MIALLHFNDDIDRAFKSFETAGQPACSPQDIQLFLNLQTIPQDADDGDDDQFGFVQIDGNLEHVNLLIVPSTLYCTARLDPPRSLMTPCSSIGIR